MLPFILVFPLTYCYLQLGWLAISPMHDLIATRNYWLYFIVAAILFLVFFSIGLKKYSRDKKIWFRIFVLFALALLALFWPQIFPHNRVLNAAWYFRVPLFSAGVSLFWYWYWPKGKIKWRLNQLIWIELLVFFFLFSALSLLRHWHFESTAWDLALYENLFWRYSHFKNAYSPIREMNLLGDHFHLTFFLLVPFYKIYPRPETLLIIQAFLVTISAYPIYLLSQKYFKQTILSLVLVFSYLTFNGIQTAVDFDFHATTIGIAFLVFAFYFLIERKWFYYFLFAVLAILTKEDYPIFVLFIGLYALIFRKEWLIGAITVFLSAFSYYLILKIIMPHFQVIPSGYFIFNAFGTAPFEIMKNIILHPVFTLHYAFNEAPKIVSFLTYFSSFGFLPFLAPSFLILGAPQLAEKFLTDRWPQWGPWNHYAAPLAFVLAFSTILSISFLAKKFPKRDFLIAAAIFLLINAIIMNLLSPGSKFRKLGKLSSWRFSQEEKDKKIFLGSLPKDISIATQADLAPHLAGRENISLFVSGVTGKLNQQQAEYLILSQTGASWPMNPDDFEKVFQSLLTTGKYNQNSPQYRVWEQEGKIYIFKRENENLN